MLASWSLRENVGIIFSFWSDYKVSNGYVLELNWIYTKDGYMYPPSMNRYGKYYPCIGVLDHQYVPIWRIKVWQELVDQIKATPELNEFKILDPIESYKHFELKSYTLEKLRIKDPRHEQLFHNDRIMWIE